MYVHVYVHSDNVLSCMCQVGASVRCLQWWGEKCVLIGCLDGRMLEWRLGEEVKEVWSMEGSVIIMRWSHSRKVSDHYSNPSCYGLGSRLHASRVTLGHLLTI